MEELQLQIKELNDNRARFKRNREELITSTNELLTLCEEVYDQSCRLNPYRYSEPNEETVDAEPLEQTTEDEAINTAVISTRNREELITSINELLPLCQEVHDQSCRLNPYRHFE
jgi:hypothetical protein